ncbi:TrpB-like pyridoxal phosphate-dependent enzyme [Desulfurispira natronophila]|uniref:Tryptophan synthase beta chain n=1 Tax=Desulfurispira natronophila TaxID=682562 RepID=A0A7W7Y5A9_9BACT|nr:TrpB-like pyridoxal phosphate-dependent enzyme [Desulfurispira natronophila]MBB5022294.1 tryptophan synthase beta chain [Desulfurispira natronophila]
MDKKILLNESEMPRHWYNIIAHMPNQPAPPIDPSTGEPAAPEKLARIFAPQLLEQEMGQGGPYVEIPEEVFDTYRIWRPAPLVRATELEKLLDTPAKIYYKYEGVSPAGSHKPNTAIPQIYYNKINGIRRIATETGAGQWGTSVAFATQRFGIESVIYMVKVSYEQKPYRKAMMEMWGGKVIPSPSNQTACGRAMLKEDPNSNGSLGGAISEALEDTLAREDTRYCLGSVLNHVALHQTIVGEESIKQMEKVGEYPDVVIGCAGGGSNLAGIAFPYIRENMINGKKTEIIAVEPTACPTLTKGSYTYDFGDVAQLTPQLKMYTLGSKFMPAGIHAGGLRYHGMSPLVSQLYHEGYMKAEAYNQLECFEAAAMFVRTEGILPAPESSHAIKAAIEQARKAKEEGKPKVILFNLSGHGHFDIASYEKYFQGELIAYEHPETEIAKSLGR